MKEHLSYFMFNMCNKVADGPDHYSNENLKCSIFIAEKVRDGQIAAVITTSSYFEV